MKNNSLTIIIPAYNEYGNLTRLLPEILSQHNHNYSLDQILIMSDGSTDATNSLTINSRKIKLRIYNGKTQKGKPARVNQALKIANTPLVVILDADVKFLHQGVIDNLVSPIIKQDADYTSGTAVALPPTNVISKIAFAGVTIWSIARSYLDPHCLYNSEGMLRAFSQRFYKNLTFPPIASIEDTYPYLYGKQNNYIFKYAKNAKVYYQLPTTFSDYRSQQRRYHASGELENTIFPEDLVNTSRIMTKRIKLIALFKTIKSNPIPTLLYLIFSLYLRLDILLYPVKASNTWEVLKTTKNL